jgi:protein phosphatase PTC1
MKDFVIAQPYVSQKALCDGGAYPFVILACDGVWDVFTDQEAVELIISKHGTTPCQEAAETLVRIYLV